MGLPRYIANGRLVDWLALAIVMVMAVLFGFRHIVDGDFFYHVANGREILSQGSIPQTNTYIWAPSEHFYYPNPAWLYGVVLALVEKMAGLTGVVLLKTSTVVALFVVLYRLCRRDGAGPFLAPVLLFVFGMGSAFRLTDRPHLFSLFFFAISLLLLGSKQRQVGHSFWFLPPLFALWSNIHAGFIVGLILIAAILCGELLEDGWKERKASVKRLGLLFLFCSMAIFFAPHPLTNLLFLSQLLEPRVFPISEYISPPLKEFLWFYAAAFLLALWAIYCRAQPREWGWLIPILIFFSLGCFFARFIPYFLMVALPWSVRSFCSWREQPTRNLFRLSEIRRTVAGIMVLLSLPLVIFLWPPVATGLGPGVDPGVAAMGSVRFLQEVRLAGRLYNSQSFGGGGAMYLAPYYRMYQSAYYQVESDRIEEAYLAAKTPLGWQAFLDRYAIEAVWLDTRQDPYSLEYYPQGEWALVYYDDFSAVYVRRQGLNPAVVAAHEYRVANPALLNSLSNQKDVSDPFVIAVGLREARRLLTYNPDNRLALALIAFFLARQPGEEAAALAVLDDLEESDPAVADIQFEKGRLLSRLGRYAEGERAFARYIAMVPDDPEGHFELARMLILAGQNGRAREVLQQLIVQFPAQGQSYLLLGNLQLKAEELDAAWTSLSRARELLTDNPEVYNLLGIIKAQRGDVSGALPYFRNALELDPSYESAQLNLRRALGEAGAGQ